MVVPAATNCLALRHQARAGRMARTLFQVCLDSSKHRLSRQLFFQFPCRRSDHKPPLLTLRSRPYSLI